MVNKFSLTENNSNQEREQKLTGITELVTQKVLDVRDTLPEASDFMLMGLAVYNYGFEGVLKNSTLPVVTNGDRSYCINNGILLLVPFLNSGSGLVVQGRHLNNRYFPILNLWKAEVSGFDSQNNFNTNRIDHSTFWQKPFSGFLNLAVIPEIRTKTNSGFAMSPHLSLPIQADEIQAFKEELHKGLDDLIGYDADNALQAILEGLTN